MRGKALVGSDWGRNAGNSFAEDLHVPSWYGLHQSFEGLMMPWLLLPMSPPLLQTVLKKKNNNNCLLLQLRR
jgi:hypothetical protein